MRLGFFVACAVLIMSCGEDNVSLGPTSPLVLYGDYSGTISFQQYAGTDSARAGTDSIYFSFYSDTTYYYELPHVWDCGYGGGPYEYSNKRIQYENNMIYPMICLVGPGAIYFVIGEYSVQRIRNELMLKQELPAFALSFEIELKRNLHEPGLL